MKFGWKVMKGLTYYLTILLFAVVLSVCAVGAIGYHYYNNYYKGYFDVQQSWIEVDRGYTELVNLMKTGSSQIKKNEDLNKKERNALSLTSTLVGDASRAMSYDEKFSIYPSLMDESDNLILLMKKDKRYEDLSNKLDTLRKDLETKETAYNEKAKRFNAQNRKFPERYISELGSFHDWKEYTR